MLVPKELVAWWVKHHSLRLHVLFNRKNNNNNKNLFLPKSRLFSIWIKNLSYIVRWRKISIFGESLLLIKLLITVIFGIFRPGGICVTLKIFLREVIIVIGVNLVVMIFSLINLSKKI